MITRHCSFGLTWLAAVVLSGGSLVGCGDSDTGPGGSGGSGGSGATGGESVGAGGAGGGAADSTEIERCLFVNACQADGSEPVGMQACLGHFYERQWHWASTGEHRLEMEAMDCRLAATTCDEVRACDVLPSQFDKNCSIEPGQTLCVDDTWVICDFDGAATAALDCSAAGKSCNVDIWAGCGTDACTFGATENSCDPNDERILIVCNPAGFLERVDCAAENNFVLINSPDGEIRATIAGEVCGDDPMLGAKGCIGKGESCNFFSQECDGDTLITCAGGKLGSRDCSTLEPAGQSCGYLTDGPFAGGAACGVVSSTCDSSADESCEGGVITFCALGQTQTISCTEAGFQGCEQVVVDGRTMAYCTN